MIKVLQMGMTDNLGGIESYLINYFRNINKSKIHFDFTNIYSNNLCFQDELEKNGAKVFRVSNYYRHPIKYIKETVKIIKENKYDIIHCNMNSAAMLYPLVAAKIAGAKVIISHSHNSSSDKGILKTLLHNINKLFIPFFANYYFACSNLAGKWFFSNKIRKSSRFFVINNGIGVKKYQFNSSIRTKKRKELGIYDKTIVIGHVGRFNKQKNHEKLIDIFLKYKRKNEDTKLLLVGIGPLMDDIKNKVKNLGIEEDVFFLGQRNDVHELMQAMDVFILPSLYEGLGIVLIEAQSAGLPCICTDVIPYEAKVSDNFYQYSLSDSLDNWIENISNNSNGKRTQDPRCMEFDSELCARRLEKIYTDSLKIKICHFVNGIVNGGVERVILNYFSHINMENYCPHIVTQGESDEKCYKEFEDMGFTIHNVTRKKESIYKNFKEIYTILKREKFNIVHAHMTVTNFFPLFYSFLAGTKVRISHSHLSLPSSSLTERMLKFIGKVFATHKFACSNDAAKYLFGNTRNVCIINNAINLEKFAYSEKIRKQKRKELGIEDNSILIGHVGRFVEQKNHDFLIDVFNELYKTNEEYKLLLIGSGDLEDNIRKKVKKLNLEKNIFFLGTRNDVNELMQAMDIFLLPSLFEGLGIVLIEAQTSGLKCVCSENTPKEVKVTQNIKFSKLDINTWSKIITDFDYSTRKDYLNDISDLGFNINTEAQKLDNMYQKMIGK